MTAHRQPPDDWDDAQLARLLKPADDAPAMREEFVRELSQRLDREFLQSGVAGEDSPADLLPMNGMPATSGAATPSMNGHAAPADASVAPRRGRFANRRSPYIAVAAASLLAVLAAWAGRPAEGWAAMIQALVASASQLLLPEAAPQARLVPRPEKSRPDVSTPDKPTLDQIEDGPPRSGALIVAETESAWTPPAQSLADGELSRQVDEQTATLWQSRGIQPSAPATDDEFMRRVYLDLTGRIPSVSEVRRFGENRAGDRRVQLVDELLASRDHATHLAAVWRAILLPDDVDLSRYGGSSKFEQWLAERFGANMPYDQLVRELLLADGRVSEGGPLVFYAALKMNPEELAARTSRAFLGMRLECAQCHDHPFDDVSQESFWGFAALFARISRPQGKMEMTSPVLQVRDSAYGDVTLPESEEIVPPRLPMAGSAVTDAADVPSRRAQLAAWLTARDNMHFSQATVNRVWSHLFGRGLVEPVDDMRPENAAIAPELLDALSRDFAASGFDLRRLLRELVLSRAYQLSSQAEADDPSRPLHFAQMNLKSFTAEQLYDCIAVATQQASTTTDAAMPIGLVRFDDMSRQSFIEKFRAPPGQATDYQAGIPQALALMHGGLIHNATDLSTSGMLRSLAAPFFTDEQRLETLFLATLSRKPTAAEQGAIAEGLAAAKDVSERQQALGDVLWALLNSAEFTFNH